MSHKLLLADDSVTIQRVIELTFADEDVNVSAVGDGQQAIERIEADPPDIILADVGMPKCDGYDVAAYVKSRPKLAHIPVVLLTGAFEAIDQARATAVGCDGVLAKPFEPQVVINRVKQLLGTLAAESPVRPVSATPVTRAAEAAMATARAAQAKRPAPEPVIDPTGALSLDTMRPTLSTADPSVSLDDYFDQLDAAFSDVGASHGTSHAAQEAVSTQPDRLPAEQLAGLRRTGGAAHNEFDWTPTLGSTPASGPANLDFSDVNGMTADHPKAPAAAHLPSNTSRTVGPEPKSRVEEFHMPQPVDEPRAGRSSAPAVAAPAPGAASPAPIADAFAALLAAEQGETPVAPAAHGQSSPSSPLVVSEDLVEQVCQRVLARLSDKVVRDTVTEMVSRIAERLVREELDRIKGSKR